MVCSVSGLFLKTSWVAHFQNHLLLTDRTERTNLFSWFKAHHAIFFPDPHIADPFLVSFLGSLLPCGEAPTASAGQYLWHLPGSEAVSAWLLPLSPTVECECRPRFNSRPLLPMDTDTKSWLVRQPLSSLQRQRTAVFSAQLDFYTCSLTSTEVCLYLLVTYLL